jgi:hypothetical protein
MKIAYFDCFSGASGNMILGALLDAGLVPDRWQAELEKLHVTGYEIVLESVQRRGLHGTHVQVKVTEEQPVRHLHHIQEILTASDLPEPVKNRSLAIFTRLAEAEARVHGTSVKEVHFHEVGAVDAIVDVVGAVLGLFLLSVDQVYVSPIHVGRGTVKSAHGTLPVPAPATLELLKEVTIYGRNIEAELVTPTGAAILTTLAEALANAPPMRATQIGYGAGTRELPIANLLRVTIGETASNVTGYQEDVVTLIETNIDDMNPEWYEHVMARLLEAGALDVFLTPIQMKRNRPAVQLSIIAAADREADLLQIVFDETTTIGVRTSQMRRRKLERQTVNVDTPYGPVQVKLAQRGGKILNISPEYRDCQRIAQEQHVPIKEVYQAALQAARDRRSDHLTA